jgi:hypothetical protein
MLRDGGLGILNDSVGNYNQLLMTLVDSALTSQASGVNLINR